MTPRERHTAEQSAAFRTYQRILFSILDDAAQTLPPAHVAELVTQLQTRAQHAHGTTPPTP